ncbi:MAG TPA: sulfotransferase [Sphingomicrobium sp.]|nr:sulfotransferase [Sphingomicrobium sp.]
MVGQDWRQLLGTASQLRRAGRVEEAMAAYRRLLSLKPDLPDSWYNLGWLERQAREFDNALESYGRALALKVGNPEEVHLNRAVIYSDHLQQPEEAVRELEAALANNVAFVPALLNLGNLREDLGDRSGAREAYARALAADPGNRLALARLAGLSHSKKLDLALAERLRGAIRSPGTSAAEQADLGFALAGMLDAACEYERAFEAARAANLASRTASGAQYDRARAEQFVDQLVDVFNSPVPSGDARSSPLFICGMFRSGSTLIEQILGSHSRVLAAGELDLIPQLVARIPDYPHSVALAPTEAIESWREYYLRGLPVELDGKLVVTDKRPDNFLHIGLIKKLFPSARILHTRRYWPDNLLSLYFLHLDPAMSYALDLDDAAHWYRQYRRLMEHWRALYPGDIFDVDYEELVREPQSVIDGVLGFLRLEREDGLLDFYRSSSAVKTASVWQVRQPIHSRSSGRWQNYVSQLKGLAGNFGG